MFPSKENLRNAEYGVVCANLSHDYREAVSYNLRKNKVLLGFGFATLGFMLNWPKVFITDDWNDFWQVESSRHVAQVTWQQHYISISLLFWLFWDMFFWGCVFLRSLFSMLMHLGSGFASTWPTQCRPTGVRVILAETASDVMLWQKQRQQFRRFVEESSSRRICKIRCCGDQQDPSLGICGHHEVRQIVSSWHQWHLPMVSPASVFKPWFQHLG